MTAKPIDLSSLGKALAQLQEALRFWHELPQGAALKPHLRSAVIQSFEFSYELSVRMLRRVLTERSEAAAARQVCQHCWLEKSAFQAGFRPAMPCLQE